MSKLITVRCTFDYVVVVDDNATATDEFASAVAYAREALSDVSTDYCDFDIQPYEAAKKPYMWDDECIPYGGDGNTRTGEYLK